MTPGKYNMTIYRGGTFSIGITARESAAGAALLFDNYTSMRMQIRPPWTYTFGVDRPDPLLELTTDNNGLSVSDDHTKITVTIPASVTETLPFSEGLYDIELVEGDIVDKILRGTVKVIDEVTI